MTVRELIIELEKIEDKDKVVTYFDEYTEEVECVTELENSVDLSC